jgi:hypothetical protein
MEDKKDGKETDSLSGIAQGVEVKLTETLLRWRYKRQGKTPPADDQLKTRSRTITDQVNEILVRRGKNIWKQLRSKTEKE